MSNKDIVKEARERFKRCAEAEEEQRKAMLLAKKFRSGDQWPEDVRIQRQGGASISGQAAQPPRPMLTIDRISQPVRNVSNAVKAANFAINVTPNGHGADDETAKIFKGLLRKSQNDARAQAPFEWAADGAAEAGIGWFRLRAKYCHESTDGLMQGTQVDPSIFDQELCFERITNSLSVYCDPSALLPTKRDALFMFVTEDMPSDEFEEKYGTKATAALDEFRATGDDTSAYWVNSVDKTKRIAEYWCIEFDESRVIETVNRQILLGDQIPKDLDKDEIRKERKLYTPNVRWYKISGLEVLERGEWPGCRIPLFPILGEELNVDGRVVLRGVIAPAMDSQRMVNYTYSGAIETVALAPKSPIIVAAGQLEGFEQIWQNANRFNYSYLPYNPVDLKGTPVPPPGRANTSPDIQGMVVMLQKSEEAIKATTGIYDPSLGNTNPREKSGRAIMALQKQTDLGQSNYMENTANTLIDAGEEYVYVAPKYYDRPGRILQILGSDDKPEQVMVGGPMAASPAQQGMQRFFDPKAGKYSITVSIGQQYASKREEATAIMGDMLEKNPQLLQIFGDLFFRDLDFPGSQEIADRIAKTMPPELQQGKDGQPNPQMLQQKLGQAMKMIEMMTQELNAKNQLIETDTIKAQHQAQLEGLKQLEESKRDAERIASDERIAKWKITADLIKTNATLNAKSAEAQLDAEMQELDRQAAAAGETAARQHEQAESDMDRAMSDSEAERGRQHESGEAERARQAASADAREARQFEVDNRPEEPNAG